MELTHESSVNLDMVREAAFDPEKKYRYSLVRRWNQGGRGTIVWIMLNPSTADALQDDPTIRRCMIFTRDWHFKEMVVVNLFALRATDPKELYAAADPVGSENDRTISEWCASKHTCVMAAWGTHGGHRRRDKDVLNGPLKDKEIWCLGQTKESYPRHPLYVPKRTVRVRFQEKI